ncbi:bifunctional enoyl-CoA hydratase/phosphate acetyltransferase [Methylosinus sp. KRF6]|uniref:bifunctional enoyl-CoA hydratase/phosphate acetyltransferase n=1 Tax=Methylosinus sp. KRF6 TaxID=2846853 RepID=UPI001C0D0E40|nr:bifunctional enoyl-CoA hydratase/phosphate acetyltransferase [Methylosinus sp. KRF6]MBU3887888.1 bifunctional enoyl-CoA hydratase/phosphate acetyltransferase [Methylosinus sp. KRF6]
MNKIENRTFDQLRIGDSASIARTLTDKDIELFAVMSGDVNPAHVDREFAKSDMFHKVVAHGMWGASLISTVLGTELPGPGTIYLGQTLRFRKPVGLGDAITVTVKVAKKNDSHRVVLDCAATNQRGEVVIDGVAEVIAPVEKISRQRVILPEPEFRERGRHFRRLLERCGGLEPIRTAVVHPVDEVSFLGAIEAARAKLIIPVLIGPEAKIRAVAEKAEVDISAYELAPTEHSHEAAAQAAALARDRKVEALMKGSLHTEEFMSAIVSEAKLRTARRMSHVFVIDVPEYPKPLFVTDAAINIYPTVEDKADIIQNAIELAQALGVEGPRVAILAAVETVSPKIKSTMDAAALCKMADRGQIAGGIIDGPLAFDNAISAEAAETKGIKSPVAGHADILVAPDLDAGNMLAKQLEYLADSQVAGIVVGARAPIILTSRADKPLARLAELASLIWTAPRENKVDSCRDLLNTGRFDFVAAAGGL